MKYELSNQHINALLAFLNRVELKGSEATSLVVLQQILSKPLSEVKKEVKEPKPQEPKK